MLSNMQIQPLSDRVLVQPLEASSMSKGGIHIPDQAKERPIEGKVLAVGPGKRHDNGALTECTVKVDNVVVFSKYSGTEVIVNGERCLIMSEAEILGVRVG